MNPEDIESLVTLIMHGHEEAIVVAGGAEEVGEKLYLAGVFKPLMKAMKNREKNKDRWFRNSMIIMWVATAFQVSAGILRLWWK